MQSALVKPAYANFPDRIETFGPEVCDLATLAGFPPDPEQELALDAMFALDPVRRTREGYRATAAFEFAVICARQNMKTGLFKMAALGWLFVTEQRLIVWSAHEMKTTKEAFLDLTILIENCPALSKRLAPGPSNGIYRGNGDESIELASGQRVMFKARTNAGGKGLTGDKVILDEAFALKPSHMGSLLPTLSARPDPQVVYGSSAGYAESAVLRGIRDRGRPGGSKSLAYLEFCAPENVCTDENCSHALDVDGCAADDMDYIRMANPALGRRITEDYVRAERDALPPEEFVRERLGWWDKPDIGGEPLIKAEQWLDLTDANSEPIDPVAFGVYVNISRSTAAIAVAGRRADGRFHVGVVPAVRDRQIDTLPGTGWIAERVKELFDQWAPCAVVIDGHSAAASLITTIEEFGVPVVNTNATDMAKACGVFYDAVTEKNIHHRGAQPLTRAVTSAKKRDLVDAWAWDRKDRSSDITQLVAVTLALHGVIEHGAVQDVWCLVT